VKAPTIAPPTPADAVVLREAKYRWGMVGEYTGWRRVLGPDADNKSEAKSEQSNDEPGQESHCFTSIRLAEEQLAKR
jgi:hypothetical protein